MSTIRRMTGVEKADVPSAGTQAVFGVEGVAIAGVFLPAASAELAGAAVLEIFYGPPADAIGGPLVDSAGAAIGVTLVAGQVSSLPPEALLGHTLRITFAAAATAARVAYLFSKT